MPTLAWLTPSSALHILRIVQESIANILRHTHATEIHVSTDVADDGVCIRIGDNGQGFDPDTVLARGAGRGLQNQRRRAAALGGKVQWDSCPQGTLFTLWLPLDLTVW